MLHLCDVYTIENNGGDVMWVTVCKNFNPSLPTLWWQDSLRQNFGQLLSHVWVTELRWSIWKAWDFHWVNHSQSAGKLADLEFEFCWLHLHGGSKYFYIHVVKNKQTMQLKKIMYVNVNRVKHAYCEYVYKLV